MMSLNAFSLGVLWLCWLAGKTERAARCGDVFLQSFSRTTERTGEEDHQFSVAVHPHKRLLYHCACAFIPPHTCSTGIFTVLSSAVLLQEFFSEDLWRTLPDSWQLVLQDLSYQHTADLLLDPTAPDRR